MILSKNITICFVNITFFLDVNTIFLDVAMFFLDLSTIFPYPLTIFKHYHNFSLQYYYFSRQFYDFSFMIRHIVLGSNYHFLDIIAIILDVITVFMLNTGRRRRSCHETEQWADDQAQCLHPSHQLPDSGVGQGTAEDRAHAPPHRRNDGRSRRETCWRLAKQRPRTAQERLPKVVRVLSQTAGVWEVLFPRSGLPAVQLHVHLPAEHTSDCLKWLAWP